MNVNRKLIEQITVSRLKARYSPGALFPTPWYLPRPNIMHPANATLQQRFSIAMKPHDPSTYPLIQLRKVTASFLSSSNA
jgi:hypothetical protein